MAKKLSSLDYVTATKDLKNKTKQVVLNNKRKWYLKKQSVVYLTMACILVIAFMPKYLTSSKNTNSTTNENKEFSYITVDINPSFELVLDKEDMVINMIAYNFEAKEIINALGYKNKAYLDVLQQLLNNQKYLQYIEEDGYMQVSVYSKNDRKSIVLEERINQYLSTTVVSQQYQSGCVDKQTYHEARQCHMSSGRYSLIKDIMNLDATYTMDTLQSMSIQELRILYLQLSGQEYSMPHQGNQQHHGNHHANS